MWTDTTRAQYARADLALPSNLTDAEWAVLAPFLQAPCQVGRPTKWTRRRIIEAIRYSLRGGLAHIRVTQRDRHPRAGRDHRKPVSATATSVGDAAAKEF